MSKLLIYIPTYNRLENLKYCINRLIKEIAGLEHLVTIYISDNCSTDDTPDFIASLKHPSIKSRHNESNIGLARNLCFAFELSEEAEYTWIIGDDDFVLMGALLHLLNAIRANPEINMFFINTVAYDEENKNKIIKSLELNNFAPKPGSGSTKSNLDYDFKCELRDLLNPKIDEVFMGSLMCYVWRSELVKNIITDEEISFDFSKPRSCYPHTYNFLHCLKPSSPSMHLSYLATANFWHKGVEWGDKGYELVVTQGLGLTLYEAIRLGYVDEDNQASYFAHYMGVATKSFKALLESPGNEFGDRLANFHPQLAEMLIRDWLRTSEEVKKPPKSGLKNSGSGLKMFISRLLKS
jgi:glycosyltransferase involved in cell wall biosynthesis